MRLRGSLKNKAIHKMVVYIVLLSFLLGMAAFLIFTNLENQVIMAYDEGRHGVNAYEMIRNDDYLVHTYQGEPDDWNLKPPLSFWAMALNFLVFGYSCVSFRLHSAVSTLVLLLMVTLWTRKRHGNAASLCVLLFLVVNPALYGLNFARTGEADALHTLFVTLSMLCLLSSSKDPRWLYGSALGFGLSFMAKSFHAAIIPAMCLLYLLFTGGLKRLRLKNWLLMAFFGVLPIAPWAIARYMRDGTGFLLSMFTTDVVSRVAGDAFLDAMFYLQLLFANPMVILYGACGVAAAAVWWLKERSLTREQAGLFIWFVFPPLLYSFSSFKLYHYIVPVMVPVSMAGGLSALFLFSKLRPRMGKTAICLGLTVVLAWQVALTAQTVLGRDDKGSMQATLAEALDRELDSGMRVYIQYPDENGHILTTWMQNDMLRALLSGDVICMDGGQAAFEEEEEYALLVIDRRDLDWRLHEYYPVRLETANQVVFEN